MLVDNAERFPNVHRPRGLPSTGEDTIIRADDLRDCALEPFDFVSEPRKIGFDS